VTHAQLDLPVPPQLLQIATFVSQDMNGMVIVANNAKQVPLSQTLRSNLLALLVQADTFLVLVLQLVRNVQLEQKKTAI
jgi:hypothetical protein